MKGTICLFFVLLSDMKFILAMALLQRYDSARKVISAMEAARFTLYMSS